ncbi:MAG: endosialidase [Lachnospiraceae bacterium]|nr:endosialidase [Lachnospiraceae bacterium]
MAVINELIRTEEDQTLSFGNTELSAKAKLDGFEYEGDLYKIKTFKEITKLEKNGNMVYESVPGTVVHNLKITDREVTFGVEADEDAQITMELEAGKEYKIFVDGTNLGKMKTNLGGKLNFSVELAANDIVQVKIDKQ